MIRNAIVFLLLVFGAFFAGIYLAYDELDPCRALAVEEARRSPVATPLAETWNRIADARRNRLACARSLAASWRERLTD